LWSSSSFLRDFFSWTSLIADSTVRASFFLGNVFLIFFFFFFSQVFPIRPPLRFHSGYFFYQLPPPHLSLPPYSSPVFVACKSQLGFSGHFSSLLQTVFFPKGMFPPPLRIWVAVLSSFLKLFCPSSFSSWTFQNKPLSLHRSWRFAGSVLDPSPCFAFSSQKTPPLPLPPFPTSPGGSRIPCRASGCSSPFHLPVDSFQMLFLRGTFPLLRHPFSPETFFVSLIFRPACLTVFCAWVFDPS